MRDWSRDDVLLMHHRYLKEDISYRDLAQEQGVSHERIRQVFQQYGLSTSKPRRSTQMKIDHEVEAYERRQEIVETYRALGNLDATAKEVGLPVRYIKPHISEADRLYYRNQGTNVSYTRDDVGEFLRRAAEICGEPLTLPKYVAVAPQMGFPAQSTIVRLFDGKWQDACGYAGVQCNPPRGQREGSISQEDCIRALRLCYADNRGKVPSYNVYDRWAKRNGQPSGGTVRSKFKLWRNALRAAFPELYAKPE